LNTLCTKLATFQLFRFTKQQKICYFSRSLDTVQLLYIYKRESDKESTTLLCFLGFLRCFLNVILNKTFSGTKIAFYEPFTQSINHFLKKKDGCQICVKVHSQISQSEAFLSWGLFDKTTLQIVPKNLQVLCIVIYK